jgi:hypothetical protein
LASAIKLSATLCMKESVFCAFTKPSITTFTTVSLTALVSPLISLPKASVKELKLILAISAKALYKF